MNTDENTCGFKVSDHYSKSQQELEWLFSGHRLISTENPGKCFDEIVLIEMTITTKLLKLKHKVLAYLI